MDRVLQPLSNLLQPISQRIKKGPGYQKYSEQFLTFVKEGPMYEIDASKFTIMSDAVAQLKRGGTDLETVRKTAFNAAETKLGADLKAGVITDEVFARRATELKDENTKISELILQRSNYQHYPDMQKWFVLHQQPVLNLQKLWAAENEGEELTTEKKSDKAYLVEELGGLKALRELSTLIVSDGKPLEVVDENTARFTLGRDLSDPDTIQRSLNSLTVQCARLGAPEGSEPHDKELSLGLKLDPKAWLVKAKEDPDRKVEDAEKRADVRSDAIKLFQKQAEHVCYNNGYDKEKLHFYFRKEDGSKEDVTKAVMTDSLKMGIAAKGTKHKDLKDDYDAKHASPSPSPSP